MERESKILHIFDDEIICRATIELYKKLKDYDQNYLIISYTPQKWGDFFPNDPTVMSIPVSEDSHKSLASKIKDYDIIILQAFSVGKAKAIIENQFNNKVFIWALWGYGLYNIVNYFNPSKKALTTTLAKKSIKQKLQDFYTYKVIYRKALKKIDICLFLLESDYQLLSKAIPHSAIWMTACYQTHENLFGKLGPFEVQGNDILIGNSSTPSNRHEIVFDKLSSVDLGNKRLITPLGYGDKIYKDEIIAIGKSRFGEQFTPIIKFMEIDAYQTLLRACGHVVMAHVRQQAFGTLLMMLLAGSKLYLSERSPFFNWFKEMGIALFSVENDLQYEISYPLSKELKLSNQKIIRDYLSLPKRLDALEDVLSRAKKFQLNSAR